MQQIWQRIGFSKMEEMFTEWMFLSQMFLNDVKTFTRWMCFLLCAKSKVQPPSIYPIWIGLNLLQHISHGKQTVGNEKWGAKDYIIEHTLF